MLVENGKCDSCEKTKEVVVFSRPLAFSRSMEPIVEVRVCEQCLRGQLMAGRAEAWDKAFSR